MAAEHLVDRLWPDPAAGLLLDDAFGQLSLAPVADRPLVGLNMITSIDGRAQLNGTADGLGSRADRRLMRLYRTAYDAVASGAGTLRADDFYSTVPADLAGKRASEGRSSQPLALLIAGEGALPTDRRFFATGEQPRAVAVGRNSPHAGDQRLPAVETWVAPTDEPEPDWVLAQLATRGMRSLLIEGGPTVNAAFLAAGVVDELYWTIGARLVRADGLPMIAPTDTAGDPVPAELISVHRSGDELFLRYRIRAAE